jgi:hypothetical protein
MRYLFGFICVLALGVVSCGETAGTGGSGGDGGHGGTGGTTGQEFACTEQGIRDAIAEGDGPHTFACGDGMTVVTAEEIIIDNDVILDGEGHLTVHGDIDQSVFHVSDGVTAELRRVTVTWADSGGTSAYGITNSGTLMLTNSTVSGSSDIGSGILNNRGTLMLTNSTVSAPSALVNCNGTAAVANSTLHGLVSDEIHKICSGGTVTIMGSLLAGGCIEGEGQPTSNGYNIESPGNTCGFDQGTDQVDVTEGQLDLGPLQDNGGGTPTHALGAGSVAIDVIPEADCVDADGEPLTTDQRGVERPQGDACDVGAFESARAAALASYCAAVLECFPSDQSCEADFANFLWVGSGGDLAACTSAKSELVECVAALDCDKLGEEVLDAVIDECIVQLGAAWQTCEVPVK